MAGSETHETKGARGTMEGDRGDAKAQPSGPRGDNPATAGSGETKVKHVRTDAEEHAAENLDPSSPGETGTTPGSNG